MKHFLVLAASAYFGTVSLAAEPKLTFGDKDAGKPASEKAGQITASGKIELVDGFANPKVTVLVRAKGENGFRVLAATTKDGKWEFKAADLAAGTYQVRVQLGVTKAGGGKVDFYTPDTTAKPDTLEVVVK